MKAEESFPADKSPDSEVLTHQLGAVCRENKNKECNEACFQTWNVTYVVLGSGEPKKNMGMKSWALTYIQLSEDSWVKWALEVCEWYRQPTRCLWFFPTSMQCGGVRSLKCFKFKTFSERWCRSEDGALAGLTLALGTSMGLSWVQNFVQTTDLANLVHLHDHDDHDQDVFLDVPLATHPLLPHGQLDLSWTNINCATLRGESIFLYHNDVQYHNYFDYYDGQYVSKMWQYVKSDNLVRNQPLKGFWRTLCWSTWSAAFHNMTIVIVIVVIDRIDR